MMISWPCLPLGPDEMFNNCVLFQFGFPNTAPVPHTHTQEQRLLWSLTIDYTPIHMLIKARKPTGFKTSGASSKRTRTDLLHIREELCLGREEQRSHPEVGCSSALSVSAHPKHASKDLLPELATPYHL